MGSCLSSPSSSPSGSPIPTPPLRTAGNSRPDGTRLSQRDKGKGKAIATYPPSGNTEMNSSSAAVLRTYATLPSPSTSLSPKVLLISNPSTIAIFDAYPKAKYHFLVLPRYPFPGQNDPDSTKSICRLDHLDDLKSLLTKTSREAREQIVGQLAETAREVEEMVRDEMVKSEGVEWKIDVGFHAIPSLK